MVNDNWRREGIVSFGGGAVIREDGTIGKVYYFTPKHSTLGKFFLENHGQIHASLGETFQLMKQSKEKSVDDMS